MFEILFDNGGGALLLTPNYCHYYDHPARLADDVAALMRGEDTDGWEGNEPEFRRERFSDDRRVTDGTVARALEGKMPERIGGHMQTEFWTALLASKEARNA